jgi:hypothetical protein
MNLEMNFVEGLRRREYPYNPNADLHIFYNLFSIYSFSYPNFLEEVIENFKQYPDDWFRLFHKSLRVADVFQPDRVALVTPYITDAEKNKRWELINELKKMRKENEELIKPYEDKYNANEIKYSGLREGYYKIPNYRETEMELRKLNTKMSLYRLDESNRISGHLDSIFWQAISNDKGDLYEYMNKFLELNVPKTVENDNVSE